LANAGIEKGNAIRKEFKLQTRFRLPSSDNILIVGNRSVLQEGVVYLLNEHSEALVHNIRYMNDYALIREIESKSPSVVIVTEPNVTVDLFLSTPAVVKLAPRIIVLSLEGNTIDVFDHVRKSNEEGAYVQSQLVVAAPYDLLKLIFRHDAACSEPDIEKS
jgi:hypothetical protein